MATALSTDLEALSTVCAEAARRGRGAGHLAKHGDRHHGALRRAGHVVRNLAGRGVLLLDRGGDRGGVFADLAHALGDAADRLDRAGGRALHRLDLRGDLLGRLGGLHRERLHLRGDDREAAAGFAGARRLDRGVEREQVGLSRDVADELDHVADLLRRLGEAR